MSMLDDRSIRDPYNGHHFVVDPRVGLSSLRSGFGRFSSVFPGTVVIRSIPCSWTGYGQIGHHIGIGLESLGIPVAYSPIGIDDRYFPIDDFERSRLVNGFPTEWILQLATPGTIPIPGHKTVMMTMWETTGLLPGVADVLNTAEAIIVPCTFNRKNFVRAGVTRPIFAVPMGVSADEGYRRIDDPPTDPFRFACAGRMAHGGQRKALTEVVLAFIKAFPSEPDVRLSVKVWPDDPLADYPDPRVTIDRRPLRPAEMAEWLRASSCYVSASRGEGWGLITLQAMAVGRPVIVIPWSGTADFWTPECGWPVDFYLESAGEFYVGSGHWATADMGSLVRAMRYAYSHRDEVVAKGRAAARRAAQFTWDDTACKLKAVLIAVGFLPKPRIALGMSQVGHR